MRLLRKAAFFNCLVYAKGRKNISEQPVSQDVAKALNGDAKGYFKAEWKSKKWNIGERVEDQNW